MPSDERIRSWLDDMDGAIRHVETFTEGMDFEAFSRDTKSKYAVLYALLTLSEASRRLPADLKERHPEIPWRNVADIGNVYRHEYHRVSDAMLWRTVTEALPPLRRTVADLRQAVGGQP
ncbi:MAG TPA: HepT-like ribonuclease domain-containing protein [Azospirillaceae bacterium]|nr:HepT-like ribonuclease domain-containing protein [Azospirillaceae bacterium]